MILLPDINVGSDKLSLQDPYTLNGKLITRIDIIDSEPEYYTTDFLERSVMTNIRIRYESIYIVNEEGYSLTVSKNYLSQIINNKLSNFFYEQGAEEVRVGENRYKWTIRRNYCADSYIRDLQDQCYRMSNTSYSFVANNTSFISDCKERLRNQGRLQEENNRTWTNYTINDIESPSYTRSFLDSWTTAWNTFGTTISSDRVCVVSPTAEEQKKYIHPYNYKPTYIKNYMPDEDKSSLLLGAEIEVAGNDRDLNKEEVVKKCIQIMNGSDDDSEDLIYSTKDSTVQIELDTMPCTLNYHKQRMNYKELFKYLDELGYKGHDCDSAGLHIHADRSYLGSTELKQQLVITKILYILEKFNDEICVIARRNNNYSQFVGKEEVNKTLHKLYSKYKDYGKKVALNLQHEDTIEFRCFRSTLKYETFILTLEFVKNIIDYAKEINIEDIELIQWSDLMNTFSDELKEYYNDRLKKENKKKKGQNKEKKDNISLGSGNLYFNIDEENVAVGRVENVNLDTVTEPSYYTTASSYDCIRRLSDSLGTCSATFEMTVSSINSLSNLLHRESNSAREELEERVANFAGIELKKKEIKDLKKRIKNSRSYMEKAHLNAELAQAQKELKRMKRTQVAS
jgi:hypothetical protein